MSSVLRTQLILSQRRMPCFCKKQSTLIAASRRLACCANVCSTVKCKAGSSKGSALNLHGAQSPLATFLAHLRRCLSCHQLDRLFIVHNLRLTTLMDNCITHSQKANRLTTRSSTKTESSGNMSGALKMLPISLSACDALLLSGPQPLTSLEARPPSLLPSVSVLLPACSLRR